jgi:hypothetical protein
MIVDQEGCSIASRASFHCKPQQLTEQDQEAISCLLARNRESQLDDTDRTRLDSLMRMDRRGLVHKAQAWKVSVACGLRAMLT